ncbi:MAG: hypothetical protein IPK52_15940 [Chloroflexi bacterium]|nr:hypothetical protein [Chloroflexota bacterium]
MTAGSDSVHYLMVNEAGASVYSAASPLRPRRASRSGTSPARRGPIARRVLRSVGRAGKDRSEVHRNRPLSARCQPETAWPKVGRGGQHRRK